jgi:hypothetical protein
MDKQVMAVTVNCHDGPAVTAFLNEAWQPDTRSVTTIAAGHRTPAVLVQGTRIDEGWSVFNGQSARPPAFRTILRI